MAESPKHSAAGIPRFSLVEEIRKRWFLLSIVIVIAFAKIYPPIGAKHGKETKDKYAFYSVLNLLLLYLQVLLDLNTQSNTLLCLLYSSTVVYH